jgi:hypothetical protein
LTHQEESAFSLKAGKSPKIQKDFQAGNLIPLKILQISNFYQAT